MSKSHAAGGPSNQPTAAQFKELFAQIEAGRITRGRFQEFLRGQTPPFPSYAVDVDYNLTVEQLVQAGKYDRANDDISDPHFPMNKKGVEPAEIFIISVVRRMSTEAISNMIGNLAIPLRHANVKEELALGAQHPDLQREGPIVALGSTWRGPSGDVGVPCLVTHGSHRFLNLTWFGGAWAPIWRFDAVRK